MSRAAKSKREKLNTYIMRDSLCPFMRESRGKCVECEGPMDDAATLLKFKSLRQLEKHARTYCGGNFRYCEVYRMVMAAKYEE